MSIWHALLLANSELTQRHAHLTLPRDDTNRAVSIMLKLFSKERLPPAQIHKRLVIAKQLWVVMRGAFSSDWVAATASQVLKSIFKAKFCSLDDDDVRTAWNAICSELIVAIGHRHLSSVLSPQPRVLDGADLRQIWNALAKNWGEALGMYDWELTVTFLVIAIR